MFSIFLLFKKWQPVNHYEKCFLLHLEIFFRSRDTQIFVLLTSPHSPLGHCFRGWLKINLKVYEVINCLNRNLHHILLDVLRKKKDMTLKLCHLRGYQTRIIFMKKPCRKCAPKINSRPFFNFGKQTQTAIPCKEFFYKSDILKENYQKALRKLILFSFKPHIIRVSLVCHSYVSRMYLYVICMSFVCTWMSSVCHLYLLVCHLYVTRIYPCVIRISLVCTRMSSVCHSYVLVCYTYVTRMYLYVIWMSLVCTPMSSVRHSSVVLPSSLTD